MSRGACCCRRTSLDFTGISMHLDDALRRTTYLERHLLSQVKLHQRVLCVHRNHCLPDARPHTLKPHKVVVARADPAGQMRSEPTHAHEETVRVTFVHYEWDRADREGAHVA